MNGRALLLGLAVFAIALVVRLAYVSEYHEELGLDVSRITQSDNHVFAEWARAIADGDLLCREQPHAWHFWTRQVAPDSLWLEWYGGEKTFHQAPLYPYFLAAVFATFGDDLETVGRVQALLGALTCLLTFLLAWRVAGARVAVIAGLLLAFCAPYYFYDVFQLRDGPIALLVVLLALALERALRLARRRDWLLLGAALGLFTLMKETGPALLGLTILAAAWRFRATPRRALGPAGLLVAGFLVLTAPAYVRNVVVGAEPFRLSTRGPEVFIAGNAAGQSGIAWDPPIGLTRTILTETGFSLSGAMVESILSHRSAPTGYLRLLWNKTRAFFHGNEIPNNVNFEQFRSHLPTLRLGVVTVTFLGPACLLGLLIGLRRRERLAGTYLLFIALSLSVIALYILGRFRLQVLPLMTVFAAITVDEIASLLRRRSFAAVPLLVALALLVRASWPTPSVFTEQNKHAAFMMMHVVTDDLDRARSFRERHEASITDLDVDAMHFDQRRFLETLDSAFARYEEAHGQEGAARLLQLGRAYTDYVEATGGFLQGLMRERALECLEEARRLDPALAGIEFETGRVHRATGDHDEAAIRFIRELRANPDHLEAHREFGFVLYDAERRDVAALHLESALLGGLDDVLLVATSALLRCSRASEGVSMPLPDGTTLEVFAPTIAMERARDAVARCEEGETEALRRAGLALYAVGRGEEDEDALAEAREVFVGLLKTAPLRADEWERLVEVIDDSLDALHLSPR